MAISAVVPRISTRVAAIWRPAASRRRARRWPEASAAVGRGQLDPRAQPLERRQHLGRLDLHPGEPDFRHHPQRHVAVDPGIGEIVDAAAERRDRRVLAAVDAHRHQIVALPQMRRQPGLERGIAIRMMRHFGAVDPDPRIGHRAFEPQQNLLPGKILVPFQLTLVGEHPLIGGLVEIAERQVDRIVRQLDAVAADGGQRPVRREAGAKAPAQVARHVLAQSAISLPQRAAGRLFPEFPTCANFS